MTEFLYKIFGQYTMQVIIQFNQLLEILFCTALFCWYFKRKKLFGVRLAASIAISLPLVFVVAVINTHWKSSIWISFLSSTIMSAISFEILFVCFDENKPELLLCWCGGVSAHQATGSLVTVFYAALGLDPRYTIAFWGPELDYWNWVIYYIIHIALYVALSLVFSRKKLRGAENSMKNIVLLSVFTVLFMIIVTGFIDTIRDTIELSGVVLIKVLLTTLYIIVLMLRTGIFTESKYKQDLKIMDELLNEEKKQFERVKDNIEIINMKCHDLKHHLSDLEGKLSDAELKELKNAIEIYDTSLKTGNDFLDVVLYEKSLVCERENIKLDCLADGKALEFITGSHVYSLFGNAINNAIEAVKLIPDPELRMISINVGHTTGLIEISVINRFVGERKIVDGAVETQKEDKARHGYGLKSIKYIASLYDGKVNVSAADGIFELQILIPPPAENTQSNA